MQAGFDDISVEQLRRRGTMKWTALGEGVLAAWVAEMDFPTAEPIRDALRRAIDASATGYPPEDAASPLPAAAAAWLDRSFGLRVRPAQVRTLPDVLRGIELTIELCSRPGSPVVVPTPSYPPFFAVVRACGREVVEVPIVRRGGRDELDLEGVDGALAAGAGTVILCNPHNPLGRVFTRDELAALAEVVDRRGARVAADEVHAPLVYSGAVHVPYATVSEAAARHSTTLVAASKGWNLPGLKCAQIVLTNDDDRAAFEALPPVLLHGASLPGILATVAAYERGGPWLVDAVAYLDGNRRLLDGLLAEHMPGVRWTMPEGTYLAWLDCRPLGLEEPSEFFLRHARVAVNDGAAFGAPGRSWVRLNFATSRSILTSLVEAMGRAVRGSGASSR